MFDEPMKLILGLLTGILFGFFLQKGRVAKYSVIIGQLLLRDWTVVKIMLTAVAVGSIGVYALVSLGMASLHVKPALFAGLIFGGLTFGAGMAVFGYCPGTSIAACGEGRKDAMVGVAGMLLGALSYVMLYPALERALKAWPDWGKITLPELTTSSPWAWVAGLAVTAIVMFSAHLRGHGESKAT
jgi:uncharacterized membrane protein YedE/YeeE